ncbi:MULTISPECIES: hypothetical protein [unclassified Pseudomonas]|uniref:hypothetical protein n=1 Tax=unclassified Pseudomonas TaxID=196821 RepID=UPI0024483BEF|nr:MULTISPECIES: hypothetical protein [unclassified Pseudomonas]MDG9930562.1 hypothetical protein [Pseudomonas sp. GD04042]MDH0484825.1 hypothetical protein [Pseudomonas sp. GD04015]MDH0605116.1 hypothetical protein [Pseudomonas sp. GD03869]
MLPALLAYALQLGLRLGGLQQRVEHRPVAAVADQPAAQALVAQQLAQRHLVPAGGEALHVLAAHHQLVRHGDEQADVVAVAVALGGAEGRQEAAQRLALELFQAAGEVVQAVVVAVFREALDDLLQQLDHDAAVRLVVALVDQAGPGAHVPGHVQRLRRFAAHRQGQRQQDEQQGDEASGHAGNFGEGRGQSSKAGRSCPCAPSRWRIAAAVLSRRPGRYRASAWRR